MTRFSAINAMWALTVAHGDMRAGAPWAERLVELAAAGDDPVASLVAHRIHAQTLHWNGQHAASTEFARRVLAEAWRTIPLIYNPSPIELRVSMRVVLARTLWMRGFPDRAAAMAREAMEHARTDSPLAECQTLVMGAMAVALWSGRDDLAREQAAQLADIESLLGFGHWLRWARRMRGRRAGACAKASPAWTPPTSSTSPSPCSPTSSPPSTTAGSRLAASTGATGKIGWCAPETLRREAERALQTIGRRRHGAWRGLAASSLALARDHGAPAWELRTATSFARHRLTHGEAEARAAPAPVFERFTEGFETGPARRAARARGTLADATLFRGRRRRDPGGSGCYHEIDARSTGPVLARIWRGVGRTPASTHTAKAFPVRVRILRWSRRRCC